MDGTSRGSCLTGVKEEVVILLESCVMAVQEGDAELLSELEGQICHYLTTLQKELMRTLRINASQE